MNTATTPPPLAEAPPPVPPPPEPPRRSWWMAKRVLLGGLGIFLLSAATTTVVAFNEVGKVVDAFAESRPVKIAPKLLAPASKGAPETLLLVGNDERPPPKSNPYGRVLPHSNEMLLVRIDPSQPTISMLSIPRELQVTFTAPNGEVITNRMNSAYTYGGAQLMVETIKRLFGLTINHVFITSFPKFKKAVDELGCVYMGVDKRYHHVNEAGGEQYFEINLQPGYQRMCGKQALEFVANRHEDTSLIRDARDQRFLLEVKAQYGASLFENREKFERILGRTVATDNTLRSQEQVLDLLELLVEAQGKPVRQVPFNVTLLKTYDIASEQQIQESVQSFLHGTAPIRRPKLSTGTHGRSRAHYRAHQSYPGISLTPTTSSELDQARAQVPDLPFPLEYPKARESFGGAEPDTLRRYAIRDQQGHLQPIYVVAIARGELGQFYDVQGTSWSEPPLLSHPDQTVRVGSRSYELFYAGEQLRVIAWREDHAVYWIENTLTESLSPRAMLAIAEQTVPVIHASSNTAAPTRLASIRGVELPPRVVYTTSLTSKIGALVGFLGLGVIALLSLVVFARQRELKLLRQQVAHALALEARQRPLFAAAGIPYAEPTQATIPDAQTGPTIYRARKRFGRGALAAMGVATVAAVLAVGIYLPQAGTTQTHPIVAVRVFNATSTPSAAHRIAARLTGDRVRVAGTGDIGTSLSPGTHVLYPPGAEEEARRIARLLPGPSATVGPIQQQLQEVVGRGDEIVVVLD